MMKIFQLLRKPFGVLGIYPPKRFDENPITFKRLITLFILVQFSLTSIVFFLFEAATFIEYADAFYISATAMLKVYVFSAILRKLIKIFELIENFESIIQNRALKKNMRQYSMSL